MSSKNSIHWEQDFQSPPDSAKPRAWWHWLSEEVTKEGITADLEWMKRTGIAGMQMFDMNPGAPQFIDKPDVWLTEEWKEALYHAANEAERLGLEMAMHSSTGSAGGMGAPWVKPEAAMKKYVWSETRVQGPKKFSCILKHPPMVNGQFQNREILFPFTAPKGMPQFYADSKVVAYRRPAGDKCAMDLNPEVTSNVHDVDLTPLTDGDYAKGVSLIVPEGANHVWVQFEFSEPYMAQAITLAVGNVGGLKGHAIPEGEVQYSMDGINWVNLIQMPTPTWMRTTGCFPVQTWSFPETSAKLYRVILRPASKDRFFDEMEQDPESSIPIWGSVNISEIELSGPRVHCWHRKAVFEYTAGKNAEFEHLSTPQVAQDDAIARDDVIDLTSRMKSNGTLEWDVPDGSWVILRMGCSLTGQVNRHGDPGTTGIGFEIDKLSAKHVEAHAKILAEKISEVLKSNFGKSFRYILFDSWECNMENWTDEMLPEFQKRRGYDMTQFMPVLTGHIVESAEISDRFLWDFRRTIADMHAENFYHTATRIFNERGIGVYAEAMGQNAALTGDGLLCKAAVNMPMGEFWIRSPGVKDHVHIADIAEVASAVHIYGKKIAAAESFTTAPGDPIWPSPLIMKKTSDWALAMGINRFIIHTSPQQPFTDNKHKPGVTMGAYGTNYTRNNTWAEQSVVFNTYLARCSHLLQQGQFVGDLAYFYGEGAPATVPFWRQGYPWPPAGYALDWVNADIILNHMSMRDGRIVLPSGMSYRALVLPDYLNQITLPVLEKIRSLVSDGAIVIAPKPVSSPSHSDSSKKNWFRAIVNDVWGPVNGLDITMHKCGKGKIYWGKTIDAVLNAEKILPDFEYNRPEFDTELVWNHRNDEGKDIFFVANQTEHHEYVQTRFRVVGKEAELWHPDTGMIEAVEYKIENGYTQVPLRLDPYGSVFVVFRKKAATPFRTLCQPVRMELAVVPGAWQINFPEDWGAPPHVKTDYLRSWTDFPDEGVKYFSGTAVYTKEMDAPASWFKKDGKLILDLGRVKEIAEVSVNGKPAGGILWKPPYQVEITSVLRPGKNIFEIKVTNLWPNRIIGDCQPGVEKQYTFTMFNIFTKDTPLLESGLLGPVKVFRVVTY